jgi:hypothetical protein
MSNQSPEERRGRNIKVAIWSSGIVVAIVLFIILAKFVSSPSGTSTANSSTTGSTLAPASLVSKITSLSTSDFSSMGQGTASTLPKTITAPALTENGKPEIVYIGAEYCPYCATERWPMVVALSRFGTFKNLGVTHSSTNDVYPNTQTFSFHGSTYTSSYITFNGIETQSNVVSGESYAPLDTPTSAEEALLNTYDISPYVPAASAGSIPFIDFGGKYLISGSTYSPSVLQGLSTTQISDDLSNPSSPVAKGVLGAANTITAAICNLTAGQPANVCQVEQSNGLTTKISQ